MEILRTVSSHYLKYFAFIITTISRGRIFLTQPDTELILSITIKIEDISELSTTEIEYLANLRGRLLRCLHIA